MSPFYFCLVFFFRWCWNTKIIFYITLHYIILDKAMMSWYKLTYFKVIEVNLYADVSLYSLHEKCNNFTNLLTDIINRLFCKNKFGILII